MIEILLAGAACAWLANKFGNAGQDAADSAVRSVKRGARDVADKIDDVRPACARGKAPHQPHSDGVCYSDGELAISCRKCGATL